MTEYGTIYSFLPSELLSDPETLADIMPHLREQAEWRAAEYGGELLIGPPELVDYLRYDDSLTLKWPACH